jgi:hypothetical protein
MKRRTTEDCWAALATELAGLPEAESRAIKISLIACTGYPCAEPGFTAEAQGINIAATTIASLVNQLAKDEARMRASLDLRQCVLTS